MHEVLIVKKNEIYFPVHVTFSIPWFITLLKFKNHEPPSFAYDTFIIFSEKFHHSRKNITGHYIMSQSTLSMPNVSASPSYINYANPQESTFSICKILLSRFLGFTKSLPLLFMQSGVHIVILLACRATCY